MSARLRMARHDASAILRLPIRSEMRKLAHMAKRAAKLSPFWAERLYPSALVQASPLKAMLDLPSELKPTGHSPQAIRNWIIAVCRRLSTTPTELARTAKLAPSTVNRFLSGKGDNENISATTLQKLTDATDQIFNKFITSGNDFDHFADKVESEADWAAKNYSSFDKTIISIPVIGFVSSEFWNQQTELPKEEKFNISVPVSNYYARMPIIGLEMRGGTSNTKYINTAILICVPFYALDREPAHGEHVIVNRRSLNDQIEVTVRQYIEDKYSEDDKFYTKWLIGLQGEQRFQAPIDVSYSDDSSLIVSFLIVASYQTEPRLFKRPKEFYQTQK